MCSFLHGGYKHHIMKWAPGFGGFIGVSLESISFLSSSDLCRCTLGLIVLSSVFLMSCVLLCGNADGDRGSLPLSILYLKMFTVLFLHCPCLDSRGNMCVCVVRVTKQYLLLICHHQWGLRKKERRQEVFLQGLFLLSSLF